jgi:thioredoxin-like negative regulator of GroEL
VQAVLSSSLARAVDVADTALLEIDSVEDEPRLSDDAARVGHAKEPAARTPTSNPLPLKPTEDPLGDELATVDGLLRSGKDVRALHLLRKLAETHEREARVLSMWSRTAAKTKAWGEALNAASKWAAVADDREALLHLARMQRVAGRSDDMTETLRRLLEADPKCAEAEAMLRTWGNRSRSSRGS